MFDTELYKKIKHDVRSIAAVSLDLQGERIGVLKLDSSIPNLFEDTSELRRILQTMTGMLQLSIQSAVSMKSIFESNRARQMNG